MTKRSVVIHPPFSKHSPMKTQYYTWWLHSLLWASWAVTWTSIPFRWLRDHLKWDFEFAHRQRVFHVLRFAYSKSTNWKKQTSEHATSAESVHDIIWAWNDRGLLWASLVKASPAVENALWITGSHSESCRRKFKWSKAVKLLRTIPKSSKSTIEVYQSMQLGLALEPWYVSLHHGFPTHRVAKKSMRLIIEPDATGHVQWLHQFYGGVPISGCSPIAGWFISWKIPINGSLGHFSP